jgi:hypothetical protein
VITIHSVHKGISAQQEKITILLYLLSQTTPLPLGLYYAWTI